MTIDQDQLAATLADARAKAEAATPGPWHVDGPWWQDDEQGEASADPIVVDRDRLAIAAPIAPVYVRSKRTGADIDHIARMDPATTLRLLDAVGTLQAENERLRAALDGRGVVLRDAYNDATRTRDAHIRRAQAAEAEAADLRTRLANVRALVLDPAQLATEGPLISRLKVAAMLDRALDGPQDGGDGR